MRSFLIGGFYLGVALTASAADEHVITVYSRAAPGAIDPRTIAAQVDNPDWRQEIPGYAMVRTARELEVARGISEIQFTDVAAAIDPTTVSIESLDEDHPLRILEQSYHYDLVSSQRILERYLGEIIEVEPAGQEAIRGRLIAARNGDLVLEVDGGRLVSVGAMEKNLKFPALPDGLITRPTLKWRVESPRAGEPEVRIGYETQGMTWWADYNLQLKDDEGCAVDVASWVSLVNNSGASFPGARLKLVAGDVNRVAQRPQPRMMRTQVAMAESMDSAAGFEEKSFFEYHLYTLGRPVDLPDRSVKQLELFPAVLDAPCRKSLRFAGGGHYTLFGRDPFTNAGFPFAGESDITVHLTIENDEDAGLGIPLPRGRVRVARMDQADGSLEFIGEDTIDHTPRRETVDLKLGNAFDVVGERRQADFRWSKDDRFMVETIEVELTNRKNEAVEVEVREALYRWSNWAIESATHDHEKVDAATVDFIVPVKPDETVTLRYKARYTW